MGKRKVQKNSQTPALASTEASKKDEVKGKKTYSLQENDRDGRDSTDDLPKVRISDKLEATLIDLILEEQKKRTIQGEVSKRITAKKLTDVYNSLSDAGFTKNQVESAMTNSVMNGGDLINALDWLCLNSQNDQLPAGFSETLMKEEEKLRPKFDVSLQTEVSQIKGQEIKPDGAKAQALATATKSSTASPAKSPGMKNWILQYAQADSSEEEDEVDSDGTTQEKEFDPTEHYSKLYHQMLELKDQAAIAKSNNQTNKHKELSKKLREIHLEMASFEKHPDFDKSVKAQLKSSQGEPAKTKVNPEQNETKPAEGKEENLDEGLNLMFAQAEKMEVKAASQTVRVSEDVRSFEYTRSQWTGKSPKQFLIDWVRKHLSKSGPPKFKKIQVKVNRFKCTAVVERQKDDNMAVTPTILCENVKEAEHLAATLALYQLCKGQSVHQLLPPTYRNVWLEWLDEERKAVDEAKEKENKPRDQFISKLIKSLKIEGGKQEKQDVPAASNSNPAVMDDGGGDEDDDDDDDDWEALADKEQLPEVSSKPTESKTSDVPKETKAKNADGFLLKELERRQRNSLYKKLLQSRQELPVFQYREKITSIVRENSVVVIAGQTGSGKSTQVPQFILEDCIQKGDKPNIICTQPRRISATSLAKRVAEEMGEKGASPRDSLVGYQIRFESRRGPNTKLVYCTTGVVLRQLQNAVDLNGVSHLIIDEVHERSVQSDFLMIVVKQILSRRPDLRVILMSATLDSQKFSSYFGHCPIIDIPGRTFPVETFHLEDAIEMTGYVIDEDSPYTLSQRELVKEESAQVAVTGKGGNSSKQTLTWTSEDLSRIDRTSLDAEKYSLRTRNAVTRMNLSRINLDLICDLLKHLDTMQPFCNTEGSVLIFLPGLSDIQDLYEMITSDRHFSNSDKFQVFALHSVLSSQDQGKVFNVPPPGVRKIVLATNIAETGITIPDVVFVIDSGKAKENRYMESSQMSTLQETFISKANCKQRAGRAGRVREGFCFRIFTCDQYSNLKAYTTPELLRVPLEELCLNIMKCGYGRPYEFLNGALDPPQSNAVARAMGLLKEVGACQTDELTLTPLGHHLAALPVDVRIGKMLLFAAIFGCLDQVAVIAAAMTDKSPFVVPLSKRSEADGAKQSMAIAQSDHITLYKAYRGWSEARTKGRGAETSYLTKNFLKRSILVDIENVKEDLIKLIRTIGFTHTLQQSHASSSSSHPKDREEVLSISQVSSGHNDLDPSTISMVKAVLTAGLYPQVGKVLTSPPLISDESKACQVETSQGTAQVHPSSVNRLLDATGSWLVYHEKVKLSRIYLRDCTLVSPFALLMFGGAIDVQHTQRVVTIDGWLKFRAVAKAGVIFKELRWLLNSLLEKKLEDPTLNISENPLIFLLKDLIKSERTAR